MTSPFSNCVLTATADVQCALCSVCECVCVGGELALIIASPTGSQQDFMIWGVISFDSRIHLAVIYSTVTAQLYDDDILQPSTDYVTVPFGSP